MKKSGGNPYHKVRGRILTFLPYPYQKLVRERNVYGSFYKFSTGTELGRVFFENEVRVREVDRLFFQKSEYGNVRGTVEFQNLGSGTGFSTEVVRNTKIIIFYITSDFLTFLKVKVWSPCFSSERKTCNLIKFKLKPTHNSR